MNKQDKLSAYFNAGKTADPVIDKDEVYARLKPRKQPIKIKRIGLWSTGIVLVVGITYYFLSDPQVTTISQQTERRDSVMPSQSFTEQTIPSNENKLAIHPALIPQSSIAYPSASDTAVIVSDVTPSPEPDVHSSANLTQPEPLTLSGIADPITLSAAEYARLGIDCSAKHVRYACREKEHNDSSFFVMKFDWKGNSYTRGGDKSITKGFIVAPMMPVAIEWITNKRDMPILLTAGVSGYDEDRFLETIKPMLIPIDVIIFKKEKDEQQVRFWYKPDARIGALINEESRNALQSKFYAYQESAFQDIVNQFPHTNQLESIFDGLITDAHVKTAHASAHIVDEGTLRQLHIQRIPKGYIFSNQFKYKNKPAKLHIQYDSLFPSYSITYNSGGGLFYSKESNAIIPVAVTDSSLRMLTTFEIVSHGSGGMSSREFERKRYQEFLDQLDELIGVKFRNTFSIGQTVSILWFPANSVAGDIIRKSILDQSRLQAADFSKLELIHADPEICKQLSIDVGEGSIAYRNRISGSSAMTSRITASGSEHTFGEVGRDIYYQLPPESRGDSNRIFFPKPNGESDTMILFNRKSEVPVSSPVMVTDGEGRYFYQMMQSEPDSVIITAEDIRYMKEHKLTMETYPKAISIRNRQYAYARNKLRELIGIKITAPYIQSKRKPFSIILWYQPNPEFISILPTPIRNEIQQEYQALLSNTPLPSCKYFDACKQHLGVLAIPLVYPNPVSDMLHIDLESTADRMLSIVVTDIQGKVVKSLTAGKPVSAGHHTFQFPMDGIPEGLYLLIITTDKGERISERLIKKN